MLSVSRSFNLLELRPWLLVIAIAIGASLLFTAQTYVSWSTTGGEPCWSQAAVWAFGDWSEWVLLSPAMFWLARRFRFSTPVWPASLAAHVLAALALSLGHSAIFSAVSCLQAHTTGSPTEFTECFTHVLGKRLPVNLAVYAAIVAGWYGWVHAREARARESEVRELRGRLAEAQLFALRMQLNPHFLHNTLNAISALMLSDVAGANRMLARLGQLLRDTLETGAVTETSLSRELEFIRCYLDIEQVRFGERLTVRIHAPPGVLAAAVPSFLLQPLVENAFRHALNEREADGELVLSAAEVGDHLVVEVADNGRGETAGSTRVTTGTQIGLANTRQRLAALHGGAQRFELVPNSRGGMTARITLPFRNASPS